MKEYIATEEDKKEPPFKFLFTNTDRQDISVGTMLSSDICPLNNVTGDCLKEKCMLFDINSNNCKLALINDVLESISCRLGLLVEIFKEKEGENVGK